MISTKVYRDSVVTRITGNTAAGTNVFDSKVTPNLFRNLPAICVYTPSQTGESLDHRNPAFRRTIDIQIEVCVASSTSWSDEVDDIMSAIKTVLLEDSTWLDQFENVPSYIETHSLDDQGEQPLALGQLTFSTEIVEAYNANR